jgi:hypothetical protein
MPSFVYNSDMDHLPLPQKHFREHIEVPLLSSTGDYCQYDGGQFLTYLDRRKDWSTSDIFEPQNSNKSVEEIVQLLQVWLFFGLLMETFGPEFHTDEFLRQNEAGQMTITTAHLWELSENFAAGFTKEEKQHHVEHMEECISKALEVTVHVYVSQEELGDTLQIVLLSIIALCDFLQAVVSPERISIQTWPLAEGPLRRTMKADGWCPSDIERLWGTLDLESLYVASRMGPRDDLDHKDCSDIQCKAYDIKRGQYKREHYQCDGCEDVVAEEEELYTILEGNALPLIGVTQDSSSNHLFLTRSDSVTEYVAISHVWSGGLGNENKNAVPRCQLNRLMSLVHDLYGRPVSFWLDTISCPVENEKASERAKKAYDLAIAFMRRTYSDADKVLVLDQYILSLESKSMSDMEQLLRILCCGWTRRLWTYQEGVLAKRLYFQFADGAVDFDLLCHKWASQSQRLYYPGLLGSCKELRVWTFRKPEPSDYTLNVLARALRYRNTSFPPDEALCLGTLIGMGETEIQRISRASHKDRVKTFWSLLSQVSVRILFWHGKRLDDHGYRWAPASFLNNPKGFFDENDSEAYEETLFENGSAQPSDLGLMLSSAGIMLNVWKADVQSFLFKDRSGVFYHATCRNTVLDSPGGLRLSKPTQVTGSSDLKLAIITKSILAEAFTDPGFQVTFGILVAISQTVDDTQYATILCPVFIMRINDINGEFPTVHRTIQFYIQYFNQGDIPPQDGNIDFLEDEDLIADYRSRRQLAIAEHIKDCNNETEERCGLWTGTSMESRRLILVRDMMHVMFEADLIPDEQKWCLD